MRQVMIGKYGDLDVGRKLLSLQGLWNEWKGTCFGAS